MFMKPGFIIGVVLIFILLSIVSNIMEMTAPLAAGELTRIDILMNPSFTNLTGWLGNLWGMLWFDYPFLTGGWAIVRYIFFIPVGVGMSVALAVLIGQLLATLVGGVGRLLTR